MLKQPTVFIIGAGAGVDIGMPTGGDLIEEIAKKVDYKFQHFELRSGNPEILDALRIAAARKKIDLNALASAGRNIAQGVRYARSIDSFIHTHRADEAIKVCGKIAIVQTIVEYERKSKLFIDVTKSNPKFQDDLAVRRSWLYDFMYLLSAGIDANESLDDIFNNLTIINFNYDRCIEHFLWKAIQELFLVDTHRAAILMEKACIFHPYGVVAKLPWQDSEGLPFGGDPSGYQIDLTLFSENIRTFNEEVQNNSSLAALREKLWSAERVLFLGFHFHQQNLELLRDPSPQKIARGISAYASTYGRSGADQVAIRARIDELFENARTGVALNMLGADCKALFVEYGTSLGYN